ncbi:hypothetical protein HJC23_004714 [Cyclotella cryptica]|uniref:Peptidase M50 domain-containing protein n=1 Tax=Cyclotella cryptica TaxID=29204 RepID=A0ABD3PS31_9STRA
MTVRTASLLHLIALFHAGATTVAFQFPTKSTSRSFVPSEGSRQVVRAHNFQFTLHASPHGDNSDDSSPGDRLPFFARTIQKILRKPENNDEQQSTPTAEKGAPPFFNQNNSNGDEDSAEARASQMMALAEKIRLEAERSEMLLALEKISKLESKAAAVGEKPDSRFGVLHDARLLSRRLEPSASTADSNKPGGDKEGNVRIDALIPGQGTQANRGDGNATQFFLTDEKLQDAVAGFEKLPQPLKDVMAKQVGLIDGTNATLVIEKLMAENRLRQADENETFAFSTTIKADDLGDILIDPQFIEMNSFISGMLPEVTRKSPLNEKYVDAFCKEVLSFDTFNPSGKPKNVPGGYIIRGESRVKSQQGRGEEILNEEDELPLLLLTNYDISPNTNMWVKPLVTLLGLASVVGFALGSFSMNVEVLDRVTKTAEAGSDLDWLYALSLPIAFSIFTTQLAHEAGHLIVALKDDIKIGFPTLIPSFQLGLTGAITPIKSPPKNFKALFDFSIAGPMLGLIASLGLLYLGLEMTAFMDVASRERLPSVPASLLRSSTLGAGIIEYLLGDGLLNTPDPAISMIQLHPFAIAGFSGLLTNALSLLPIGNTDGGRISLAFFGRSFSRVVHGSAVLILALSGLFGADESNILISYALYSQLWQKEPEIPCRNEVDELDAIRGSVAIAMSVFVMLALIPLS